MMRRLASTLLAVALVFLCIFGIGKPGLAYMKDSVREQRIVHRSQMQPIILIPGSSATQERFNSLIRALNHNTRGHSLLKITVEENNHLKVSGSIAPRDNTPYIVVAFADNKDGYPTIKKQARWFNVAFKALAKRYHFNRFAGIGHSNGGLVYTLFLEHYFDSRYVTMTHLVTIGTPYNLEERNPSNKTQLLEDLLKNRYDLPKDLSVDSIAGSETLTGDGTVPLTSVEAGRLVFQNQVAHFTQTTVTGDDTAHSDLPQNQQIIKLIKEDILTPIQEQQRPAIQ